MIRQVQEKLGGSSKGAGSLKSGGIGVCVHLSYNFCVFYLCYKGVLGEFFQPSVYRLKVFACCQRTDESPDLEIMAREPVS